MKAERLYRVSDFVIGMRVEVSNKYSSDIQNGVVTTIDAKAENTTDGVTANNKIPDMQVTIEYDRGGSVILDDYKILDYAVRKIG